MRPFVPYEQVAKTHGKSVMLGICAMVETVAVVPELTEVLVLVMTVVFVIVVVKVVGVPETVFVKVSVVVPTVVPMVVVAVLVLFGTRTEVLVPPAVTVPVATEGIVKGNF